MKTAVLEAKRARLTEAVGKRSQLINELEVLKKQIEERDEEMRRKMRAMKDDEEPDAKRRKEAEEAEQAEVLMGSDDEDEKGDEEEEENQRQPPEQSPTAPEVTNDDEGEKHSSAPTTETQTPALQPSITPQPSSTAPQPSTTVHTSWTKLITMMSTSQEAILSVHERAISRAAELRASGAWLPLLPPRQPEPVHPKLHWDLLLDEMVWLSTDFIGERKWKCSAAAFFAAECAAEALIRKQKRQKKYFELRELAFRISHNVEDFWQGATSLHNALFRKKIFSMSADVDMTAISPSIPPSPLSSSSSSLSARFVPVFREAAEWLGKVTSGLSDCVFVDIDGIISPSAVSLLVSGPASHPALVVVPRSILLEWRFALRIDSHYSGGNPLVPRLITLTTPDIVSVESNAFGAVPWSVAIFVVVVGGDSFPSNSAVWDMMCASCKLARSRVLVVISTTTKTPPQSILESAAANLIRSPLHRVIREWRLPEQKQKHHLLPVPMTRKQRVEYDQQLVKAEHAIAEADDKELAAVRAISTLRAICNHPHLISSQIAKSPFVCQSRLSMLSSVTAGI